MKLGQSLAREADFPAVVGSVLGVGLIGAAALGAVAFERLGDWLYPTWSERFALLGFLASAATLGSLIAGAALWLLLRALRWLDPVFPVAAQFALLGLSCLGWLFGLLRTSPQSFYASPVNLGLLGLSLLLTANLARRRRAWRRGALLTLMLVPLAGFAAAAWLHLVSPVGAPALRGPLHAGLWLLGLLGAAIGVRRASAIDGPAAGTRRASAYALAAVALLSAISVAPLYRLARAASEPPADSAQPAHAPSPPSGVGTRLNLILISIDTLRADHMGIYGYAKNTTPQIDRFFADAVVFTRMYAQSPWTLPSHVSMLTGQYPSTHDVRYGVEQTGGFVHPIPDASLTVAEILRDAGYATAAFTGGSFVSERYGFDQGFDDFETIPSARMSGALERGLAWLERHHRRPFFLFLHSFDVHIYQPLRLHPELGDVDYAGPLRGRRDLAALAGPDKLPPLSAADLAYLEHLYDSELRETDFQLQRLFDALERLGRSDDTAILLTSDHGEEFLEHGRTGHGYSLAEALLRVPLLISVPGLKRGLRSDAPVQGIDITPTLLDLAGVALPPGGIVQGRSLLPLFFDGGETSGSPSAVSDSARLLFEADVSNRRAGLVDAHYKYVHHGAPAHNPLDPAFLRLTLRALFSAGPREELFDLAADPGEREDLSQSDPQRTAHYRQLLFAELRAARGLTPHAGVIPVPLTPELAEELRALGYLE